MFKTTTIETTKNIKTGREWEITWGKFKVLTRLAPNAPQGSEGLPTEVKKNGISVWKFQDFKSPLVTMTFLREYEKELVLVLTNAEHLTNIIFVADLPVQIVLNGNEKIIISSRSLEETIVAKNKLARIFNKNPLWSIYENPIIAKMEYEANEIRRQEQARKELAAKEEKKKREDVRAAHRDAINARPEVQCFNESGEPRHGKPVVGKEWECLLNNSLCVLVQSYDPETKTYGELIRAFRVVKGTGNPKEGDPQIVHLKNKESETETARIKGVVSIPFDNKTVQAVIYDRLEGVPLNMMFFGLQDGDDGAPQFFKRKELGSRDIKTLSKKPVALLAKAA